MVNVLINIEKLHKKSSMQEPNDYSIIDAAPMQSSFSTDSSFEQKKTTSMKCNVQDGIFFQRHIPQYELHRLNKI